MSAEILERNKQLVRDYVATWNRGDLEGLSRFWSSDMVHHTRTRAQTFEEVRDVVGNFMGAFPDLHFELDDIVAEGDRVVTRMTATGTNHGSYLGVEPTYRQIHCNVMGIARVRGDRIVEHWGVTDELAMMAQMGMLPEEYLAAMA
ncbi:MAG TPA: ester cyclase [Longimicrobium sp.]|jgi:predicted ester cyclase